MSGSVSQARADGPPRRALVTGAASPTGSAIVRALRDHGTEVVAVDIEATVHGLEDGGVVPVQADLTLRGAVEALFDAYLPRLDLAVMNTGQPASGALLDTRPDMLRATIDTVATTAFLVTQLSARSMIAAGVAGRLIYVGSIASERAVMGAGAYSAANAMLATFARVTAVELGAYGITANVVMPGWTESAMAERIGPDRLAKVVPLRRLGRPGEVAAVCAFLASEQAGYITGAQIPIDGGLSVMRVEGPSPLWAQAT